VEKRRNRRYAKRVKVRFGETGFTHAGFTADISATGMFVVTGQIPKVGTRLHVEVTMELDRLIFFEGQVARQTLVAPELRQIMRGGFGVRLLTPSELMAEMVPQVRDKSQLQLRYETLTALKEAYDKELKRGGVFLWADKPQLAGSVIGVELEFPFASRTLTFEARVVHTMPEASGRHGVALMFLDGAGVAAALAELMGK
jgi:Tfp pilus assembly protein PilZ